MAKKALIEYALYTRQSCRAFGISETCYRHEANLSDDNAKITDWLLRERRLLATAISKIKPAAITKHQASSSGDTPIP